MLSSRVLLALGLATACAPTRAPATAPSAAPPANEEVQSTTPPPASPRSDQAPWIVATSPDLRTLTFLVAVTPPPAIAAAYKDLGSRHRDLGPLMDAHNEGGFGSGFLVVAGNTRGSGKRAYVVTNQHVVGLATEVILGRESSEARATAQVIYVDSLYDLAIVELSEEATAVFQVEDGFGFSTEPPKDQEVVIASGFPGIEGAPSYQVTRGYVSNQRVLIDLNGTKLPHIQHTAAIDSGSSGGPLLDEQNRVLGINTMKVRRREGVGMAVPATAIQSALMRVLEPDETPLQLRAEHACKQLLGQIGSETSRGPVDHLISAELIAQEGSRSLWLLAEQDPDWASEFVMDPAQVMAHALVLRLRRELASNLVSDDCQPQPVRAAGTETFAISVRKGQRSLTFAEEQGTFKLRQFDFSTSSGRAFLGPKKTSGQKWKPSL